MRKYVILLIATLWLNCGAQQLSIDSCMRYAAVHNHDARTAAIGLVSSRLSRQEASAAMLPSVGASIGAQYSFGRSIDPATNTYSNLRSFSNTYSLWLNAPLFSGGRLVNDFRKARASESVARSALESKRDLAAIAALDACINALYYQELTKIMEEKHAESLDALRQARRMKELGLKSAVDISQSEAQEADDDYSLTAATAQWQSALLALKSAMAYPLADSIAVAMPAALSGYIADGITPRADNPTMMEAEARVEEQRLGMLAARGDLMPSLTLNAGISDYYYSHHNAVNETFRQQMDVNFGQYVGVTMSIPLFSGLSRINGYRRSRCSYAAAQVALERTRYKYESDFAQAVLDRDNYAKEIVKMERKTAADSTAYALARRKFDEGLMDALDMRRSADNWFAARTELLRCRLLFDAKRRLVNYYLTNKLFD